MRRIASPSSTVTVTAFATSHLPHGAAGTGRLRTF
jgi:hypothetical protein